MAEKMLAELTGDGDVVVRNPDTALAFFTSQDETGRPNGADDLIARVREFVAGFKGDVSSAKGRSEIKSTAFKVTKAKTTLEKEGKRLADEQKLIPKKIDACRRYVATELERLEEEVRRPLTEWEEREAKRITEHKTRIDFLESFQTVQWTDMTAAELMDGIRRVDAVTISPATCEEFLTEYAAAKDKALAHLKRAYAERTNYDAEQEELAQLRAAAAAEEARKREEAAAREAKEREERAAAEARERAKREAEEIAQRAIEEANRRARKAEMEAQAAAQAAAEEKARADEAEANARAKAAAEAREAKEREEEETRRREENRRHVGQINRAAMNDLIAGGLPDDLARTAITLIAQGKVKHVSIAY